MDVAGAASLQRRLEQQKQWQLAEAVRDGRQFPVDPDCNALIEIGDGIRLYSVQPSESETQRVCKRLVEGRWQREVIDESAKHDGDPTDAEHVAYVSF